MGYVDHDGEKYIILIHMFAGRRRQHDFHDWIKKLSPDMLPGYKVLTLSLDTAISTTRGNLDRGDVMEKLTAMATYGWIAGALTGPPCETFSAARHIKPAEEGGRWPRPLRHPHALWGLRHLSNRELRQLATGSRLMLLSLLLEARIGLNGSNGASQGTRWQGPPIVMEDTHDDHLLDQAPLLQEQPHRAMEVWCQRVQTHDHPNDRNRTGHMPRSPARSGRSRSPKTARRAHRQGPIRRVEDFKRKGVPTTSWPRTCAAYTTRGAVAVQEPTFEALEGQPRPSAFPVGFRDR